MANRLVAPHITAAYDGGMFQIKICGITTVDDALDAAQAGATAIGLNFYAASKRFVDDATAERISLSVPPEVMRVGVFVNASAEEITAKLGGVELDAVQLHGDEPAALLAELPRGITIIRAIRCGPAGLAALGGYLVDARAAGRSPDALLVDSHGDGDFGGTGQVADWSVVDAERDYLEGLPLILAGGLDPRNVATAIETVRPDAVDVASGVEGAAGRKDAQAVREFVAAAREAFGKLAR